MCALLEDFFFFFFLADLSVCDLDVLLALDNRSISLADLGPIVTPSLGSLSSAFRSSGGLVDIVRNQKIPYCVTSLLEMRRLRFQPLSFGRLLQSLESCSTHAAFSTRCGLKQIVTQKCICRASPATAQNAFWVSLTSKTSRKIHFVRTDFVAVGSLFICEPNPVMYLCYCHLFFS